MKAIVTGGAGFIGSHLAEALCEQGNHVVVVDNFSYGQTENLRWAAGQTRVEVVDADIKDINKFAAHFKGCDTVFHQAAAASVPYSVASPIESNAINLDASLGLLLAARDASVRRFVFASSSAIYGNGGTAPRREEMPPEPLSPYALQKYAAERYAQQFYSLYGLETVALRYFNVFGPRQSFNSPYSGVIARFATAILAGERPAIFGDGLQSRDFVYIANVVQANLLASQRPAEKVAGKVFNIGGGESINLLQLVGELNRLNCSDLQPVFREARMGDVLHSSAEISRARDFLEFKPAVSWQKGLEQTLEFYKAAAKLKGAHS